MYVLVFVILFSINQANNKLIALVSDMVENVWIRPKRSGSGTLSGPVLSFTNILLNQRPINLVVI
jgi:hypothetical protein